MEFNISADDKRKNAAERIRKWRAVYQNKKKQNDRRNFARKEKLNDVQQKEREYYQKNKDHILERSTKYNKNNPQVKKKSQEKCRKMGKGIFKGKKERKALANSYVVAQIKKEGSQKTISQKQAEILIYRIKKIIKNT